METEKFNNKWNVPVVINFEKGAGNILNPGRIYKHHIKHPDFNKEEIILIIADYPQYINKFKEMSSVYFEIFWGFEKTSYGLLMYFLFALSENKSIYPEYLLDMPVNIFDDATINDFTTLINQKYFHLYLMDSEMNKIRSYEIENNYDLWVGISLAVNNRDRYSMDNLFAAVREYNSKYSLEDLYSRHKDGFYMFSL